MSKRKSESASSDVHRAGAPATTVSRVLAACVPACTVLVAGCAPVTTLDGERISVRSDAFADYVEEVFREQNRVATELAFAFEDTTDPERLAALEAAEEALLAACAGLNALAAARRDGERPGPIRGLSAARQAPECERAAANASRVLERGETPPAA